jgi:hypothetical protein
MASRDTNAEEIDAHAAGIVDSYKVRARKSENLKYRSPGDLARRGGAQNVQVSPYPLSKACFFSNSARAVRAADSNCSARSINAGCAVA